MKKFPFSVLSIFFLFSISGCNPHAMAGFAEGLNKGLSNRSYDSTSSNRSTLNDLKRQQENMKREQEQMERQARSACRDLGGRWRIGRCKF